MITPYEMTALTTYDSYQLARLLAISGYSGMSLKGSLRTVRFAMLWNSTMIRALERLLQVRFI
jgi:hypothetical protein